MPQTKNETDYIRLLLAIIEHVDGKIKWDDVAKDTGLYKKGKFVLQAFNSIKTKYSNLESTTAPSTPVINGEGGKTTTPKTPSRKRAKAEDGVASSNKKSKAKVDKVSDEDQLAQDDNIEDQTV